MPNLNILSSHALIRSASQLVPPVTFLRDRYFPTKKLPTFLAR